MAKLVLDIGNSDACVRLAPHRHRPCLCKKNICCPVRTSGRMTIAQRFIAGAKGIRDEVRETDYSSFATRPSSELLGYCQSSAARTGRTTLCASACATDNSSRATELETLPE